MSPPWLIRQYSWHLRLQQDAMLTGYCQWNGFFYNKSVVVLLWNIRGSERGSRGYSNFRRKSVTPILEHQPKLFWILFHEQENIVFRTLHCILVCEVIRALKSVIVKQILMQECH